MKDKDLAWGRQPTARGPKCGPPRHFTRPATFYCHPARSFFSLFNERYAAIYRRNDFHFNVWSSPSIRPKTGLNFRRRSLFFLMSSPSIRPKKGLNFWRGPFSFASLEWWWPAGTLLGLNVAH